VDAAPARDGTVWIAEDVDREEPLLLTGRFSGYLDRDQRPADTFEDLEAEDAIAWGRARAATVLIRTGDRGRYFSAGEHNPDPQKFAAWPPAGLRLERRRPRGFEALDNTEGDPPVLWDVRITVDLPRPADMGRFEQSIRTHPAAQEAQVPAPGYHVPSAAFLVKAATRGQAEQIANRVLWEALAPFLDALPTTPAGYVMSGPAVYPHRPGLRVRGPGVGY
jgi:hypothetical protein